MGRDFVVHHYRSQSTMPQNDPGSGSTADVVGDEAAHAGQSAEDAGDRIAQTAAAQARELAAETTQQARELLEQGRQQLREQVALQQEKVASRLVTVADELREMAHGSGSAPVRELACQSAEQLDQLASWLKDYQADDLLTKARRFARRRRGAFVLGAALAGVVAGRLTSSGIAAMRQSDDTGSTPQPTTPPSPPPGPPPPASPPRSVTSSPPVPTPGDGHGVAPTQKRWCIRKHMPKPRRGSGVRARRIWRHQARNRRLASCHKLRDGQATLRILDKISDRVGFARDPLSLGMQRLALLRLLVPEWGVG